MQPVFESVNNAAAINQPHFDFELMAPIDVRFPASLGISRESSDISCRSKNTIVRRWIQVAAVKSITTATHVSSLN